jgi:uncharacterized protein YfaS (alpha-2-macroglobulin family)
MTKGPSTLMAKSFNWQTKTDVWTQGNAYATMKILDSFDKEIYTDSGSMLISNGTVAFSYKVPEDTQGGDYKIKIESSRFPTSYRKFRINEYSQPEMFVTMDFE